MTQLPTSAVRNEVFGILFKNDKQILCFLLVKAFQNGHYKRSALHPITRGLFLLCCAAE
jgi:hypothetical protein